MSSAIVVPPSAAAAPARGGNSSNNVLSDKVNRALHVRTDTPAMRAALDALSNLQVSEIVGSASKNKAGSSSTTNVIDAKSVRAAIEKDALRRALEFQTELQKLARDATTLRERVDNVAKVANLVGKRVESQIITIESQNDNGGNYSNESKQSSSSWDEERNLAAKLASAQKSYIESLKRQKAVNAFLDKFDLGEDEARLLDHYNFDGFAATDSYINGETENLWAHPSAALHVISNPSQNAMDNAMLFLNALERLTVIRRELTKTFGSGNEGSSSDVSFDYGNTSLDGSMIVGMDEGVGGGQSLGTNSALRMMEQLASRQERAHERLYTFLQFFLGVGSATPSSNNTMMVPTSSTDKGRSMSASEVVGALGRFHDGDDMDEAFNHLIIRRALHVLRHSPAHHVHALELIASGRRTEVTRRFLLALTSGYSGMAPLEMKAHDPVGYVGDMLAFAFRAFRVEGELVKTLFLWNGEEDGEFNEKEGADDVVNEEEGEQGDDKPMDVAEMLSQCMGGLSRPLRTRVSQVVLSLASQGGGDKAATGHHANGDHGGDDETSSSLNRLVSLFSVCGLLRFYSAAVEKAMEKIEKQSGDSGGAQSSDNPFQATCVECLTEAADSYVASLRAYGAMLVTHATVSSQSEAQLAHRVIVRISEERAASPGFAEDFASDVEDEEDIISKQLSLSFLAGTMIDAATPHLKTLDDSAALKSALTVAVKCGLKSTESRKWNELVQSTEKNLVDSFVDKETDEVLQVCGLEGLRSAMRHMSGVYVEGMTMSSHPGLSQRDVEAAMKKFYSSLFSPPIPTFEEEIKDAEVRQIARSKTAQRVVDVYQELYEAITSEKGGYADLSFLAHDPNNVRTLLAL